MLSLCSLFTIFLYFSTLYFNTLTPLFSNLWSDMFKGLSTESLNVPLILAGGLCANTLTWRVRRQVFIPVLPLSLCDLTGSPPVSFQNTPVVTFYKSTLSISKLFLSITHLSQVLCIFPALSPYILPNLVIISHFHNWSFCLSKGYLGDIFIWVFCF